MITYEELPFEDTCDTYCSQLDVYKESIVKLNIIIMEKNEIIEDLMNENKSYRDALDRLYNCYGSAMRMQDKYNAD